MQPATVADPLRVGIVGLGRQGIFHLQRLGLREDCRCLALYDLDHAQRMRFSNRNVRMHANWQDFLGDPEIELALIATHPATHVALACEALEAGKHVALEKPMCLSSAEADAILATASANGRIVSVIQTRRWDSDYRTAWELAQSGKLGRVKSAKWIVRQFSPPLPGAAPATTSAGVIVEFGTHAFDQLLQFIDGPIRSVYARAGSSRWSNGAEDEFETWIQFECGASAQIEVSLSSLAPLETGWILNGEFGGYTGGRSYRATEETELVDGPLELLASDNDAYYAGLVHHLRRGGPLPCPGTEARRVVALVEAVRQSAMSGELLRVEI